MGHIKHCFNCKLRWVVLCCMIFSKGRVVWYCHKFSNFHAQVLKSFPSSSTFIGVKSAFCLSVTQTSWTEMSQNHPFLNVIPAIIHLAPASCLPNYFLPQIDDHKTLSKSTTKHCQNWHKNSQREHNSPCQLLHFTKNLWLWKAKHREDFGCVN